MCLTVDIKKHPYKTPIILKEDLECVKILRYFKSAGGIINYDTPYEYFPIELNKLYISRMSSRHQRRVIYRGFHSFASIETLDRVMYINKAKRKIFKCIYPKGTRIYYGTNGDIVGNKIIITDKEVLI